MPETQPVNEKTPSEAPRVWLRPGDRASLLVLAISSLTMIVCYWFYRGGHRGELIEIDRAPPLQAKYQVDINRADWPEIIQLPRLGETLARRIIDERSTNGPFHDVDDLVRVRGIGQRTLEQIRPYLLPIPKDTDWAALDRGTDATVE